MDPLRRLDASAAFGAGGWLVAVAVGGIGAVEAWVLLAVLAVVPLALPLAATPRRDGTHHPTYRLAATAQPGAAVLVAASALLPDGPAAAALALPWLAVTGALAAFGLWRLLARGAGPPEAVALDAGLVYVAVGGVALVLDRLGLPLGFRPVIVHLTVVHFHYAGLALPLVVAMTGRHLRDRLQMPLRDRPGVPLPDRPQVSLRDRFRVPFHDRLRGLYRVVAADVLAAIPLLAVGITAWPLLEVVAALALAAGVVAVAGLLGVVAADVRREAPVAAALLGVAAASVAAGMAFAAAYAVGAYTGDLPVTIPEMVRTHGVLNAAGFALPAVLAWRRLAPPSQG